MHLDLSSNANIPTTLQNASFVDSVKRQTTQVGNSEHIDRKHTLNRHRPSTTVSILVEKSLKSHTRYMHV